mmetsp:Transcript_4228/g.5223  ORF Transcript_4228/g.5223 Transcript_4228/m.5223 type:complete len:960 (-) Transcript_4228:51-2930(-)
MAARGTLFALCLLCCTISFVLGARRDHGTVEWMGSDSSMECTSNHNYRSTALSGTFGCSEYSPLTRTTWVLQAQSETMQLVFDFVSFNTVNGTLKIYDGHDTTGIFRGSFSGSMLPTTLVSYSNIMYFYFITEQSVNTGTGWQINWSTIESNEISPCTSIDAVTLTGSAGNIGCKGYTNSLSRSWSIQAPEGEQIVLVFEHLYTEKGADVVSVYDGPSASNAKLGTFTGYEIPFPVLASGNEIYVTFITDYSVKLEGFTASWMSLASYQSKCFASSHFQTFQPQGYIGCPFGYGNDVDSTWLLVAPLRETITVSLLSVSLEEDSADKLLVYDGSSTDDNIIGSFSGISQSSVLESTGNQMLIELKTDSTNTANGFHLLYRTQATTAVTDCSTSGVSVLTDSHNMIGCANYSSGITQEFSLQSTVNSLIALNWTDFSLTNSDTVYVYDGNSAASPLIYSASGTNLPEPIVSSGQYLFVQFNSTNDNDKGFSATYEMVPQGALSSCTESADHLLSDSSSGIFGCDGYGNDVVITWEIETPPRSVIQLNFAMFDIESSVDYLVVRTAPGDSVIATFTGTNSHMVMSTTNNLFIEFHSNDSESLSGFTAEYRAVYSNTEFGSCLSSDSSYYTDNSASLGCTGYASNVTMEWKITVDPYHDILLYFDLFETEKDHDMFYVFDGPNTTAPLMLQHSGNLLPSAVRSSTSSLYVVFKSDKHNNNFSGIGARYREVERFSELLSCSGSNATVLSYNADTLGCNGYSEGTASWSIVVASGFRVSLSFSVFDIGTTDTLAIYDGTNSSGYELAIYAGDKPPSGMILSTRNSVFVEFNAEDNSEAQGFSIEYVSVGAVMEACSTSSNIPLNDAAGYIGCGGYEANIATSWNIRSFGQIYVHFERFNIGSDETVDIYDGSSDSAPLLASYSGTKAPDVHSTGTQLFIVFQSSFHSSYDNGFSLSYFTNGQN